MMQPSLTTSRLVLRPFVIGDAATVQRLARAREVADTTLSVPHPYEDGMAEAWIATHAPAFARGEMVTLAVTGSSAGLIGAISLRTEQTHRRAELGYWIGVPHWGRGYATEAGKAVIRFGFEQLSLNRIHACHLRQHVVKWDRFEDLAKYAILRSEWTHDAPEKAALRGRS